MLNVIIGCYEQLWLSGKQSACQYRRRRKHGFDSWVGKIPWSRKWQPTLVFLSGKFHGQRSLVGCRPWGLKESDTTEWLGTQASAGLPWCFWQQRHCLQGRGPGFPSLGQEDPLEKEMTTHSSIPAWKIPWTEEPGGPQSMGCKGRPIWATNTFTFTQASMVLKPRTSRCSSWILKRQRNQRWNCQHPSDHRKKQERSRKASTSALLTMLNKAFVQITTNCGKFLKRWEYQTTSPASWETCMHIKKQQLELGPETTVHETKEYIKAVYCHPVYLSSVQNISCEIPGWMNHSWNRDRQEKYHQPQICRWNHSNGRKWRGTEEPLDELKEESKKAGLKLNIQKTKIMASSPITSWQIGGGKVETVFPDFLFSGSKITADGDCSHETKRHSLERKLWQT